MVSSAYFLYKWDFKAALFVVPAVVLFAVILGIYSEIVLFLIPAVLGAVGGYVFKKKRSFNFFLIVSSLTIAVLFTGSYYFQKYVNDFDNIQYSKVEIVKSLKKYKLSMAEYLDTQKVDEKRKNEIVSDFDKWILFAEDEKWISFAIKVIPFTSFLYGLFFSAFGFLFLRRFFNRISNTDEIKGLEYFRLNEYCIFSLLGSLGLILLFDGDKYSVVNSIAINAILITAVLYFIQALGVVKFFIIKKGVRGYLLPLFFIISFLMGAWIFTFIVVMFSAIGTLDLWADFRKFEVQEEPEQ